MALVKFSALISGMWGKLNGSIFSSTRQGYIIKNKFTPTNPQTPLQQSTRARIAFLSSNWKTLTDNQRLLWNNAASSHIRFNHWGDPYIMSGYTLFLSCNINLSLIALNFTNDYITPPSPTLINSLASSFISTNTNKILVEFAPFPVSPFIDYILFATPPLSAGINYVLSQYRQIGIITNSSTLPFYADSFYFNKFPNYSQGQKVFFKLLPISNISGDSYPAFYSNCIIQ